MGATLCLTGIKFGLGAGRVSFGPTSPAPRVYFGVRPLRVSLSATGAVDNGSCLTDESGFCTTNCAGVKKYTIINTAIAPLARAPGILTAKSPGTVAPTPEPTRASTIRKTVYRNGDGVGKKMAIISITPTPAMPNV